MARKKLKSRRRKDTPTPLQHAPKQAVRIVDSRPSERGRWLLGLRVGIPLAAAYFWRRLSRNPDQRAFGRQLTHALERMGVLWIKVGQLLSMRTDWLDPVVCDELAHLQERVSGFPPEESIARIEESLGRPLDELFVDFEREPFAAASIAQVHRARLRDDPDRLVAVKVRRPGIEHVFESDMALLRYFVLGMSRWGVLSAADANEMTGEVEQFMREELDYRYEATNIRRMHRSLKPHGIRTPKVYRSHTSGPILTMDFLDGALMSDYLKLAASDRPRLQQWLRENNIKPEKVARTLFHSHLRQTLEDNLFHGDLHPGNVVLFRNSKVGFLDFGCIGSSERDFLDKYLAYTEALVAREYSKVVDLLLSMSDSIPPGDLTELKTRMMKQLDEWETKTQVRKIRYDEKSIVAVAEGLTDIMGKYRISGNSSFMRMARAVATMDASLRELFPEADFNKLMREYFVKKRERQFDRNRRSEDLAAPAMPITAIPKIAYQSMANRSVLLRRVAQNFEGGTSDVSTVIARFFSLGKFVAVATFALFFALFLTRTVLPEGQWMPQPLLDFAQQAPQFDPIAWLALFFGLGYLFWLFQRLVRNFERPDYHV